MYRLLLAALLASLPLSAGCDGNPAVTTARPASAGEEPAPDQLRALLDKTLDDTFQHRRLDLRQHAAWQILHAVLACQKEFLVDSDEGRVSSVQHLLDGGAMKGWLNPRRRDTGELTRVWAEAGEYIRENIERARQLQNADGSFSTSYFARVGSSPDLTQNLGATGHACWSSSRWPCPLRNCSSPGSCARWSISASCSNRPATSRSNAAPCTTPCTAGVVPRASLRAADVWRGGRGLRPFASEQRLRKDLVRE